MDRKQNQNVADHTPAVTAAQVAILIKLGCESLNEQEKLACDRELFDFDSYL
jgi:hypothetical protein